MSATPQQQAPIDAMLPFSAVRSVTVAPPVGTDPLLVITGCGGGIVPLEKVEEEAGQPVPWDPLGPEVPFPLLPGNPEGLFLRTGGSAWKIRVLGARTFVAAGKGGLVHFDRADSLGQALDPWPIWQLFPGLGSSGIGDVRALAVVGVDSSTTRVLIGTVEGPSGPRLHLINPDATGGPSILQSVAVGTSAGKPVGVVEAYVHTDGTGAKTIRILAGTECGGVVRYVTTGPNYNTLVASASTGNTWPASPSTALVRDIEIDPVRNLAFVGLYGAPNATSMKGVWGLEIKDDGTLAPLGSPPWQIIPDSTLQYYVRSLAYDPVDSRLVVGLSRRIAVDRNYVESCNKPVPCDCGTVPDCDPATDDCDFSEGILGIKVYRVGSDPSILPSSEASLTGPPAGGTFSVPCWDLAIRRDSSTLYYVDVAGDDTGYRIVRGLDTAGTWTLSDQGLDPWGNDANDGLLINECDGLRPSGPRLYLGTGTGLATLDVDRPLPLNPLQPVETDLLEEVRDRDVLTEAQANDAGVLTMTSFQDSDDRLITTGTSGVRWFKISGRDANNPVVIDKDVESLGRVFFATSASGFTTAPTPPCSPNRWVYVSHFGDETAAPIETGSLALYCAGAFGAAASDDPAIPDPSDPTHALVWEIAARYVHNGITAGPHAALGGIAVLAQSSPTLRHLVYVVHSAEDGTAGEPAPGLLTLEVKEASGGPDPYTITKIDQDTGLDGTPPCFHSQPAFAVYDASAPGHPRLYAAFHCNGFAVYDLSNPANPVREGSWTPQAGQGISIFKVMRGPATSGQHRLILAGLNHGFGVIEDAFASSITPSTPVTWYATPFQTAEIVPAGTNLMTWWAGCTKDGLIHVDFSGLFGP